MQLTELLAAPDVPDKFHPSGTCIDGACARWNARAGLAAEGGLVAQVERLTELLFWDEAGGAA